MKCPSCQIENPDTRKFCRECGARLLLVCPKYDSETLPEDKFCGECGQRLEVMEKIERKEPVSEAERKHVTVLFSDLSGYTAISERLDPEEVKEIMGRIFEDIAQVITKYEGFIEKFIGDAVVAVFGVPKVHEDGPLRAIRAVREIHALVEVMSPQVEEKIGQTLSMHTGINTGLVVTGEVDLERRTHGVSGDTINVASRLSSLAKAGETRIRQETYRQAEGHFSFEDLEATKVKGKAESVQLYKVLSPKERPVTIHRLSGLRADLIGRKAEIAQLREAVEDLRHGKCRIFSIRGDAGTGRSRLVEEFKATLDLNEIQWLEGRAYAYAQNIPYFPLVDLFNKIFGIEEGDGAARAIVDYGQRHSNIRSQLMGHVIITFCHLLEGDFPSAVECCKNVIQISSAPFYSQTPRMLLGMSYVSGGQPGEAEKATQEVVTYSQEVGAGIIGALAYMFLGVVLISEGHVSQESSTLHDETRLTHESKSQVFKRGSLTAEDRRE